MISTPLVYERLYRARGQEFELDAACLARLIKSRQPASNSLLDVACGTGSHLHELEWWFDSTFGIDNSEDMCAIARGRARRSTVWQADMYSVECPTVDVITILTSTVGYCDTVQSLQDFLKGLTAHLTTGGILVVDPWWTVSQFDPGRVVADEVFTAPGDGLTRVTACEVEGRAVQHRSQYLMFQAQDTSSWSFTQQLHMFTNEEYVAAVESAGLEVEQVILDGGFAQRGLILGHKRSDA